MTDIAVERKQFQVDDRDWLLFEAQGNPGPVPTSSGVLDLTAFTAATHYPQGWIPSGVLLALTADGRLGPYEGGVDAAAPVGFLYNAVSVTGDLTRKVGAAYIDSFAVVSEGRLPAGSGIDADAKSALSLIQFRA